MDSFHARITPAEVESIWRAIDRSGLIDETSNSVIVHDLDRMRARIGSLVTAFPRATLHAVAIKANPLVEVLKACVEAGAGLEAASMEEVHLALAAGCPPQRIIFDSPAKTVGEINECLQRGIHLNADNFFELARIDFAWNSNASRSTVGLRVNPEVSAGAISLTSVGSIGSKFGVSIGRDHEQIVEAFRQYDWLVGLHIHVGSQGCGLDLLCDGVAKIQSLREAIEAETGAGFRSLISGVACQRPTSKATHLQLQVSMLESLPAEFPR